MLLPFAHIKYQTIKIVLKEIDQKLCCIQIIILKKILGYKREIDLEVKTVELFKISRILSYPIPHSHFYKLFNLPIINSINYLLVKRKSPICEIIDYQPNEITVRA